jgi:hypothetical protein
MFLAPWSMIVEGKASVDAFHFFTISFLRHTVITRLWRTARRSTITSRARRLPRQQEEVSMLDGRFFLNLFSST